MKNFDTIKAAAMTVFNWLKGVFAPVFNFIKEIATVAFYLIVIPIFAIIDAGIIVYNWLKNVFAAVFGWVKDAATTAFNAIMWPVKQFWDGLQIIWGWLKDVFTPVWNVVKDAATKAWDAIMWVVQNFWNGLVIIWGWVKDTFSKVWDVVKSAAVTAFNAIMWPIKQFWDGLVIIYNWLKKNTFNTVWDTIKTAAVLVLDALLKPINAIKDAFNKIIDVVKSVIDWISKIHIPDLGSIASKLNPFSKSAPRPGRRPLRGRARRASRRRPGRPPRAAGGSGVTIVIQGAIDPVSTAEADPADPPRRHPPPRRGRGGADMSTGTTATLYVDGARFADGSPGDDLTDPVALSGLSVVWGRDTTVDQPAPSTCSFTVARPRRRLRSFLDLLHTGLSVDVTATGTEYPDPTVSTYLDPWDETDPIAATPQNATVGASTRRVHGGSRALQVLPVDGTRRWTVTLPPAPYVPAGTSPGAWDAIPQTEPGQTWQVGAWIWAPRGVQL